MLAAVPILAVTSAIRRRAISGTQKGAAGEGDASQRSLLSAGIVVNEVVSAARTVAAFGAGPRFYRRYEQLVLEARAEGLRRVWIGSFFVAFAKGFLYALIGGMFAMGGWLVETGSIGGSQWSIDEKGCAVVNQNAIELFLVPIMVLYTLYCILYTVYCILCDRSFPRANHGALPNKQYI